MVVMSGANIEATAEAGHTPLILAQEEHTEMAVMLLENGTSSNGQAGLHPADPRILQ
jgi:hypothetical protein